MNDSGTRFAQWLVGKMCLALLFGSVLQMACTDDWAKEQGVDQEAPVNGQWEPRLAAHEIPDAPPGYFSVLFCSAGCNPNPNDCWNDVQWCLEDCLLCCNKHAPIDPAPVPAPGYDDGWAGDTWLDCMEQCELEYDADSAQCFDWPEPDLRYGQTIIYPTGHAEHMMRIWDETRNRPEDMPEG